MFWGRPPSPLYFRKVLETDALGLYLQRESLSVRSKAGRLGRGFVNFPGWVNDKR
jgi:hypothetical protein